MNANLATGRNGAVFTARQGSVFAVCLVLSFFVGPALGAVLDLSFGPVLAQSVSWLVTPVWAASFLFGGAVAGNAITGRRGYFPFSIAFFVFPLSAAVVIGQSIAFHDDYHWRRYEHALDFALFNIAYPLTFAAMGWVSTIILTRRQKTAWSAAVACALNGAVGGVFFSLVTTVLPLRGYIGALSFAASVAIPAFLNARRISAIVAQST
jgi:hypothetical protein